MARPIQTHIVQHILPCDVHPTMIREGSVSQARDHDVCEAYRKPPRILVLDGNGAGDTTLPALCGALDITLIQAASCHDLPLTLHQHTPIAVISLGDTGKKPTHSALRSIAAYDAGLPVLLISEDDLALDGIADAVEAAWGLSQLSRMRAMPGPQDLIRFLFLAGQRAGTGRLMPLS